MKSYFCKGLLLWESSWRYSILCIHSPFPLPPPPLPTSLTNIPVKTKLSSCTTKIMAWSLDLIFQQWQKHIDRISYFVTPRLANHSQWYGHLGDITFFRPSTISCTLWYGQLSKLVAARFVWKGMSKQVREWAKACVSCQLSKVQWYVKAPLEIFKVPHWHFEHIHADLVGPILQYQGFTYLFTIVDRFTRWPDAVPLMDMTTLSCAQALITTWVTRFGVPTHISSNRGSQFTS